MSNRRYEPVRHKLSPQARAVFDHMLVTGSISGLEASNIHRVRSLPRRILDIEKTVQELRRSPTNMIGTLRIERERKKDVLGQRYTRYHLKTK